MYDQSFRRALGFLVLTLIFVTGWAGAKRPTSSLRIYLQTVEVGAPGTQIMPILLLHPNKQIMVRAQPELSERDIEKVESRESDIGVALRLILTEHGKTVLSAVTTESQGKILVVMLNGRVIYAPVIDKTIDDGVLIIPRGAMPEEIAPLEEAMKYSKK